MDTPSDSPSGERSRVSSFSGSERAPPSSLEGPEAEVSFLRLKVTRLEEEIVKLKKQSIRASQEAEAEEECLVNRVLKRVNELKKEKEDLILSVEQEEEFLTNTLQRKLSLILQEKEALERRLSEERAGVVGLRDQLAMDSSTAEQKAQEDTNDRDPRISEALSLLQSVVTRLPVGPEMRETRETLGRIGALLEGL